MTNNRQMSRSVTTEHIQLIDVLAQQLGCFVSDLRTAEIATDVIQEVDKINPKDYPVWEWMELYTYLIGSDCTLDDISAIKADILACKAFRSM